MRRSAHGLAHAPPGALKRRDRTMSIYVEEANQAIFRHAAKQLMAVIRTFANTQSIIRARVKHDRCLNPLFKTRIVYDI